MVAHIVLSSPEPTREELVCQYFQETHYSHQLQTHLALKELAATHQYQSCKNVSEALDKSQTRFNMFETIWDFQK